MYFKLLTNLRLKIRGALKGSLRGTSSELQVNFKGLEWGLRTGLGQVWSRFGSVYSSNLILYSLTEVGQLVFFIEGRSRCSGPAALYFHQPIHMSPTPFCTFIGIEKFRILN